MSEACTININTYFITLPYSTVLCHIEMESKIVFSSNIFQNC